MKRNGLIIILFFTAILFFAGSCGQNADNASKQDEMTSENNQGMQDQITIHQNQFWTSNRDYTFDQRNEFRDDVNAAIDRLNDKIISLEETASKVSGDTKQWYNDRIEELKEQRKDIQKDLQNFDKVTADNWDSFKSDITSAWNDIEHSYGQMAQDERMQGDQQY